VILARTSHSNKPPISPFSHAVDAARPLFGVASVLYGFGVMVVFALLALWWAARPFRRATA